MTDAGASELLLTPTAAEATCLADGWGLAARVIAGHTRKVVWKGPVGPWTRGAMTTRAATHFDDTDPVCDPTLSAPHGSKSSTSSYHRVCDCEAPAVSVVGYVMVPNGAVPLKTLPCETPALPS